jgi:hypothetical protein
LLEVIGVVKVVAKTPPKNLSRKRCEAASRYTLPRSRLELVLMLLSSVVVSSITPGIQRTENRHTLAKREPIELRNESSPWRHNLEHLASS